ncbi:MAG: indolepyruvate ferredoxin oxidoreductase subunit alpha [Ruminococcaceae bacterium]|nr:indolepyruvate ferredoxin oxidoreductase subunit alpha [Oscillospiraceae bacterium]
MKQLLLGNQAVARGLYEAGVRIVSSYPGTPSTEITEAVAKYEEVYAEWAPNEKVAAEVAIGASFGGARAFCGMKHVGLNVAADPIFTASYTGVNAGLVIGVADDPGMHSSQNEQDSRNHAIASKIMMLEPSDSAECLQFAKLAFDLSERFNTPVMLRLNTRVAHSCSIVETGERVDSGLRDYEKSATERVMVPAFARAKHVVVEQRQLDELAYAENCDINTVEFNTDEIGVITAGPSYCYAKEALGGGASYLKLGIVNPLPVELIKDFASRVKKLYVIEELDPVIERHCRALGIEVIGKDLFPLCGEFSQGLVRKLVLGTQPETAALDNNIPMRPPAMCSGCPHRGVFYTLKKLKLTVAGDIGCYTLGSAAPLNAIDWCVCMGASISSLHGFNKARGEQSENQSVAVIGDSTFIHSGVTSLINIAYNRSASVSIILDNSITGMTGHQQNPTTGVTLKGDVTAAVSLEKLCESIGIKRVRVVDPYDLAAVETALREELAVDEPSVIISRRPCVLLRHVKAKPPVKVSAEKCKSCKVCMSIGCPSISMRDGKAHIDSTLCVGCGVCTQLCRFDAIEKGAED